MVKTKWLVPLLLAVKDFVAYQITIPWGSIKGDPQQYIYMGFLMLMQSGVSNVIVYNHLVSSEAKKEVAKTALRKA